MNEPKTMAQALADLQANGYSEDFSRRKDATHDGESIYDRFPEDFKIDKYFRFDNDTDPADQSIVYAISSRSRDIKGVLVNGFGIYSDEETDRVVEEMSK